MALVTRKITMEEKTIYTVDLMAEKLGRTRVGNKYESGILLFQFFKTNRTLSFLLKVILQGCFIGKNYWQKTTSCYLH
jgi:hypothetical protein